MDRLLATSLWVFLGGAMAAQSPTALVEFEVASVKVSPPPDGHGIVVGCKGGPGTTDPGIINCENVPFNMLLMRAFDIGPDSLDAPEWTAETRFNVMARLPAGATNEQLPEMWRRLLADRFKLAVHRESRVVPQYDLVPGKNGIKFAKASAAAQVKDEVPQLHSPMKVDQDGFPELSRPGMIGMNGHIRLYQRKMTMDQLVKIVSGQLSRPVTNRTGLTEDYEIRLSWIAESSGTTLAPDGPTLAQALQDQLGLRLESKRAPIDFLVVDHAEKAPTEN